MITGSDKWYTVAERVRVAVNDALTTAVQRSGVVPGRIAWDACDCGMLAVSVARVYLSDDFPQEQTGVTGGCDAAWEVAELAIQIIRCAPNPPDGQLYPSVGDLDASAREVATDAHETLTATARVLCQMESDRDVIEHLVRAQPVQGPEGGCVGSELRAFVALPRG